MTGRLGKPNVSGDRGLKDEPAVKTPEIGGYRQGEIGALVIHRQQQPLYLQLRVNDSSQASQRVEELRDSFEGVVFALDRHQ